MLTLRGNISRQEVEERVAELIFSRPKIKQNNNAKRYPDAIKRLCAKCRKPMTTRSMNMTCAPCQESNSRANATWGVML